jgi:hypothetical protein
MVFNMKQAKIWKVVMLVFLMIGNWIQESEAIEFEETVFRTGIQGESQSNYSVSPNGSLIVFNIHDLMFNNLRLLDLKSGRVSKIPAEASRTWEMTSWSRDGKQVVAVSTAIRDNAYQVGEQEIILIDPRNWRHRKLAATPGVNIFPFFSADGKTVYYFKGKKRKNGKTPASDYVLYAYDLTENRETRMTNEVMHQIGRGYDDGNKIMFSVHGFIAGQYDHRAEGIYVLDKVTQQLLPFNIDQNIASRWINFGDRDAAGNTYFEAAKDRLGGGNYLWFGYRCDAQGNDSVMLRETTVKGKVRVASDTGEIFINAVADGEIIFRRLVEKPEVQ